MIHFFNPLTLCCLLFKGILIIVRAQITGMPFMRVLIIGAGIAGLSLAGLLKQRGVTPFVIDRATSLDDVGYMLGLYPTGANVLRALDCYDQYLECSVAGEWYQAYTSEGKLLKQFSFSPIVKKYGPYQLISRYELLNLIHKSCGDLAIQFNTQIDSLHQNEHEVTVRFSNKTEGTFDLVVGADGLHSQTRSLILTNDQYQYFDTGWGGWVWWSKENSATTHTIQEFWGAGRFFGTYPVKGKVGLIAAVNCPTAEVALQGISRARYIEKKFSTLLQKYPHFFENLPADDASIFFWPLNDQRSMTWHSNRVVLLGDSAAAFLPTAGVGASMALESAAVLNDMLSRTGVEFIPHTLMLFEKRRRARVERAQNDSRRLAKMMFVNSTIGAVCRNFLTQTMPVESLIKSIIKGFDEPI
ncbi:hypothetical protein B6V88_06950 [Legionella micdadei]|nr:hypothetical protein B6V88_06950 [Legionella micdadei]